MPCKFFIVQFSPSLNKEILTKILVYSEITGNILEKLGIYTSRGWSPNFAQKPLKIAHNKQYHNLFPFFACYLDFEYWETTPKWLCMTCNLSGQNASLTVTSVVLVFCISSFLTFPFFFFSFPQKRKPSKLTNKNAHTKKQLTFKLFHRTKILSEISMFFILHD